MFGRLEKIVGIGLIVCLISLTTAPKSKALNSWSQNTWVGGSGQTTWSDSSKFLSSSNTTFSVANQLKLAGSNPSDWYDANWQYRKQLTIDADLITGADPLTDFPLLVNISSDTELAATVQDGAEDIRFTASDGITLLNSEIESFDEATGSLKAWVSLPTVSATTDTVLYMYYGNTNDALAANHNPESVWSNYNLVLHLNQSSGQFLDSTSNHNNTTTAITDSRSTTGQINGAIGTTNDTGQLIIPHNPNTSLDMTSDFTLSFWVNPTSGGGAFQQVIQKTVDGSNPNNLGVYLNNNDVFVSYYTDGFRQYQAFSVIDYDQWNHVTYRRAGDFNLGTMTQSIYVDGEVAQENQVLSSNEVLVTNTSDLLIARQPSGYPLWGALDEIRISNTPFSSAYIAAEYSNQKQPNSFVTLGAEEEFSLIYNSDGNLVSSIFDATTASDWGTLTLTSTTPASTTVGIKIRTGNLSDLSDSQDFTSCPLVPTGSDISSSSCVSDGHRYIQYQVSLATTDTSQTPLVEAISLAYTPTTAHTTPPSPTANQPITLPTAPSCQASVPVGEPDLFQIERKGNLAHLYFTPVNDHTRAYHVIFGYQVGDQRFGSLSEPVSESNNQGVQIITIRDLDPQSAYWFQIAGVNGCAVGSWSNWLKADRLSNRLTTYYRYVRRLF